MPSFNPYCSIPAFWSNRVEVTGWAPVSCEYALRAWLYRAMNTGTYNTVPAIWFIDGEVNFGKHDSQVLGLDVPSEAEILSAVNTLQNYHFTFDELSFANVEIEGLGWVVRAFPTNNVAPAPTAEELGAYTLALNGLVWALILQGFVLPNSGVRCDPETFFFYPEYEDPYPGIDPSICLIGLDDYTWSELTAEAVATDLAAIWEANTPGFIG